VGLLDLLDLWLGQVRKVGVAKRRGDYRRGRRRDAVGSKYGVVRGGLASEPLDQLVADLDGELATGQLGTAEPEAVILVPDGEMHQLVGHLVVVLQRMHQADRLQAMLQRGIQR
jgi:hypothetical protein